MLNEQHAATLKATLATGVCGDLSVQFDDVAIGKRMVLPDLLSFEARLAPYASKLQRARQVVVHESRDIGDRLAAA